MPGALARLLRYANVSLVAAGLAQGGLAAAYGLFRWGPTAAVGFSLAVSVVPSYLLNRRFVWPDAAPGASRAAARLVPFSALALVGSALTAAAARVADALGHGFTANRALLTLAVNGAALLATLLVWAARFWLFDRFLFARLRPAQS